MTFNLGIEGKYKLSENGIKHIIDGNLSDRQDKDENGNTILTKIIAGGLHTIDAWNSFLNYRPDIKHGLVYNPKNKENWYYARQLQNGVILLRIPRNCFQSQAANITKFPETYYKSGYLWKSLFPIGSTKDNIIKIIDEALHNIDENESGESLLIGYVNKDDLFKSMKIRIQIREDEILSAFPTWEQPMTGNNGKPFSHIDSINTIISSSCVFANNDQQIYISSTLGNWNINTLNNFYNLTPEIIKNRKPPKKTNERKLQLKKRNEELFSYGENLSEDEVKQLYVLCSTEEYIRHTPDFIRFAYNINFKKIKNVLKIRNSICLYQNLLELITIINAWDLKNGGRNAFNIIKTLLKIRFIRTGGLDQWEMKRLSNLILKTIESYRCPDLALEFISDLIISPLRIAFYVEFNLNPYFLPDPVLIGLTGHEELPLTDKHFYDYVVQNLGINYTQNFEDDFNIQLAKKIQNTDHIHGLQIVQHMIPYAVGSDFNYFSMSIIDICKSIDLNADSIKIIEQFLFDYYRCVAANIQRILAKHKSLLIRDLDYGDKEFIKYTKAKHEYKFLWMINKIMIEELSKFYRNKGYSNEANKLEEKYLSLYKEVMKIPMPKSVPVYLKSDERG
ncbi:MAG: hypothetical protein WCP85_24490 [Mariniphaga sp.]